MRGFNNMGNTFIIMLTAKVAYKTLHTVSQLCFLKVYIENDLEKNTQRCFKK